MTYDVRPVNGARNAIIEFSAPTDNFASAVFFTGNLTAENSFVNNFTNPNGDRLDGGDDFGMPGETAHVPVSGTHGTAVLTGPQAGLSVPAADCDSAYQVRVLATNARPGRSSASPATARSSTSATSARRSASAEVREIPT